MYGGITAMDRLMRPPPLQGGFSIEQSRQQELLRSDPEAARRKSLNHVLQRVEELHEKMGKTVNQPGNASPCQRLFIDHASK